MSLITELTEKDRLDWDAYVKTAPWGLPQHLSGWREILHKTNGYETHYLLARQGEHIVGVLPLFIVRSLLVGRLASTLPGGLCADSADVAAALIAQGQGLARQAKAKCLTLHDTRVAWPGDLSTSSYHVHWLVTLEPEPELLWQRLDGNIRRQVRLARRNDLTVEIDRTGAALGAFYDVFSRFTHQHGTPVFSQNFLEAIVETFPAAFNIVVVRQGPQPIGAYFQLELGQTMYGVWGASLREYLNLRPAYLAHWEILSHACLAGFHYLDMGRSPTASNASKYKGQWGGEAKPVYQQVTSFSRGPDANGIVNRAESDRGFQLMKRLWPKLPRPVVQYLGPKLRRHVPFA